MAVSASTSQTQISHPDLNTHAGRDGHEQTPEVEVKTDAVQDPCSFEASPANPKNWSTGRKIYQVSIPALFGFICVMASSTITMGTKGLIDEFHVSQEQAVLPLSLYVLGLAFGPVIAAPLSEHLGRSKVYMVCILSSSLFTLGCGLSQNFSSVLACRFFAGFFGGPVLAIGSGTIADVFPPVDRAICVTLFTSSAFFGPIMGPVQAGFAVERLGWRWTQWIILFWTAFGLVYLIPFKETHGPTLLKAHERAQRKKNANRQDHENGLSRVASASSKGVAKDGWNEIRKTLTVLLIRPVRMLCTEPILLAVSAYIAFNFGIFYCFFASFPLLYTQTYGFSLGIYGLSWLPLFVGSIFAVALIYTCDERIYKPRHFRALKEGKTGGLAPENRLYPAMYASYFVPISLFWFGWTARADVHWICPMIAAGFFTLGSLCVFVSGLLYLTDTYGALLGASALAANGLLRYAFGTVFPLFSRQMFTRLGFGWASSLLGFISLALCTIPYVLFQLGPRLRSRSGRSDLG